jgi:hypothetical protein
MLGYHGPMFGRELSLVVGLCLVASCGEPVGSEDEEGGVTTNPGEGGGGEASSGAAESEEDTGDDLPTTVGTDGDGDGDGDPACFEAPEECLRFVECIAALVPDQTEAVAELYGEDGTCWCEGEKQAQDCYTTCVEQLEIARSVNPTEPACHESSCALAQLDPNQPYGPIEDGVCPPWVGGAQTPFVNPVGLPGSYCAPECSGQGECPDHTQTAAEGSCELLIGDISYCALRCWVDPTIIGGNQCHCGARCQPYGGPDGEGNLRGLCTFSSP